MSTPEVLFLILMSWNAAIPLALVFCPNYDDGVVGRLGLLLVSFASLTFLFEIMEGTRYTILPQTLLMLGGFTIYLSWHAVRFYRRLHAKGIRFCSRASFETEKRSGAL